MLSRRAKCPKTLQLLQSLRKAAAETGCTAQFIAPLTHLSGNAAPSEAAQAFSAQSFKQIATLAGLPFAAQPLLKQHTQTAAQHAIRLLHSGAGSQSDATAAVQQVLQTLSITEFRQFIDTEAEARPDLSYQEWADFCRKCNVAHTEEEVASLLKTLTAAGVVLHFQDRVYLQPKEIAETILSALKADFPSSPDSSVQKLALQLQELDEKREEVEMKVDKRVGLVLWGVGGLLLCQLAGFAYYTFVLEDSHGWDVVEPVSFHVLYSGVILSYFYFLFTREEFTWDNFRSWMRDRQLKRILSTETNFDLAEYERMAQKLQRHKRLLMRAAK